MNNFISILCFLVTSISSVFAQSNGKNYTDAYRLIEVWLDAQREYDKLPGITAAITNDQALDWSGAYGLLTRKNKCDQRQIPSVVSVPFPNYLRQWR